jgi:hypothetical protein
MLVLPAFYHSIVNTLQPISRIIHIMKGTGTLISQLLESVFWARIGFNA